MFARIKRRRVWKLVIDLLCVFAAFMFALAIRFEMSVPPSYLRNILLVMPVIAALFLLANGLAGIYRGRWKYASFDELVYLVAACGISTVILFAVVAASSAGRSYVPLSVTVMGGVLSLFCMGGARLAFRFLGERRMRSRPHQGKPVLLVGAGEAGEIVARDMLRHPEAGYVPAGFVDDDPAKRNLVVQGVPVLGTRRDIPSLMRALEAEEVFITIPSARGEDIREIVGICEKAGARIKILPGIIAALGLGVGLASVRELELEDLLGREPVNTDIASISSYITDRRVMVTGAGGSIGSELCRQLAVLGPSELTLLDNDETALYELELELMALTPHRNIFAVVADIRDAERINAVFKRFRPQVVFHSAAHKHVPIMELHPSEAVKTNVLGTRNLALAALLQEAERFILISTDKAVKPANVMGATKRVAEMMVKRLEGRGRTRFGVVRFGNVLGSRGSVVPTFKSQIERGGPLLITHPEATRYFMTIPEAAQLVIQAGAYAEGGEVFILDMGEPMLIRDLAEKMIALLARGRRIEIQYTGLRPGEKLHEELVLPAEETLPTSHPKISRVLAEPDPSHDFEDKVEKLIEAALREREVEIRQRLKEIVPSYVPAERESDPPVRVVEFRREEDIR